MTFLNALTPVVEAESHHPDLYLHSYNILDITLYTFSVKALTMNDFIVAAKLDQLPMQLSKNLITKK